MHFFPCFYHYLGNIYIYTGCIVYTKKRTLSIYHADTTVKDKLERLSPTFWQSFGQETSINGCRRRVLYNYQLQELI